MQIDRTGRVVFGDASIAAWEEPVRRGALEWQDWERQFKRDVFKRMIQQLRRMGWSCEVPADMIERYGYRFACLHRYCRKGDLQGFLDLSGRVIKFQMWQDVHNVENSNGGRYDFNKESRMPYLLRLRMERTRRRLRRYLCNVFSGYEFRSRHDDGRHEKRGPGALTALEWVDRASRTSGHYVEELGHARIGPGNDQSGDRGTIAQGDKVYALDYRARVVTGTAYYNLNNMWWVVTGKYDVINVSCHSIYLHSPGDLRRKRNDDLRRRRLERELQSAVKAMNFHRAETLKRILFPGGGPLYMIYHKEHHLYFRPGFRGYTNDTAQAGRYTEGEMGRYMRETDLTKPVLATRDIEAAA